MTQQTNLNKLAQELRAAMEGKTEGPWEVDNLDISSDLGYCMSTVMESGSQGRDLFYTADDAAEPIYETPSGPEDYGCAYEKRGQANARFIAHAGTHAETIAKALEEADARIKELEGEVSNFKVVTSELPWCIYTPGIDTVEAMASYEDAIARVRVLTVLGKENRLIPPRPYLWPYSPEQHAADIAHKKQEKPND